MSDSRITVITGASSGIGLAAAKLIAQKLSVKGYTVRILPSKCKDFNEQLCSNREAAKQSRG